MSGATQFLLWLGFPAFAQPLTSAAYIEQAAEHLRNGQAQIAVEDYSQAIRLRLDNDVAWIGRGRAYSELGRYSAAIDDFDQAIRLNPAGALPYIERGYAYGHTGDFERAIAD